MPEAPGGAPAAADAAPFGLPDDPAGRRFALIANPHAGRGRAALVMEEARAALERAGARARGEATTSIEHARALAAEAARAGEVAVGVGGDGLLRAVAAGAAAHRGVVGVVPAGRGNDFARSIGVSPEPGAAVRTLLSATPRPTDLIAVAAAGVGEGEGEDLGVHAGEGPATGAGPERMALGNVYVGFDSLANVAANRQRVNLGQLSYAAAALRVALTMPVLAIELVADGERIAFEGSGVAIANTAFYGGAVPVAPGADPHDGLLDVIAFGFTGRRARVRALLAMRHGLHVERSDVRHLRARSVRLVLRPVLEAYADGDPVASTPLQVAVRPGAIGLLRPS